MVIGEIRPGTLGQGTLIAASEVPGKQPDEWYIALAGQDPQIICEKKWNEKPTVPGWNVSSDGLITVPPDAPFMACEAQFTQWMHPADTTTKPPTDATSYITRYSFAIVCMTVDLIGAVISEEKGTYTISCSADAQGQKGPYHYTWSSNGTPIGKPDSDRATFQFAADTSGWVEVAVQDSGSCSARAKLEVSPSALAAAPGPAAMAVS